MEKNNFNEVDLEKILNNLERIFINMNKYCQSISLLLDKVKSPLLIDDKFLLISLKELKESIYIHSDKLEKLDIIQVLNEIKYIGNRLNTIESDLKVIKNNGIEQNICIDIYKDRNKMTDKSDEGLIQKFDSTDDELLNELLNTFNLNEKEILINRLGLFGKKKSTLIEVGKMINLSAERIRLIQSNILRKLRHPSKLKKVQMIKNKNFKKAVFRE